MELIGFPSGPPEPARGLRELLEAWVRGERSTETRIAYYGILALIFVGAVILFQVT